MNKGYAYFGKNINLASLLFKGYTPDFRYIPRYVGFYLTSLSSLPLKLYENLKVKKKVANQKIQHDPIFILGHMRSGTTHLHNLMALDEHKAYVSTYAAYAPEYFMFSEKVLRPFLNWFVPEKRPMDNMPVHLSLPQEEEFSIFAMSQHSFFYHMLFPKNAYDFFSRYALFEKLDNKAIDAWKKAYMWIVKKFTYAAGGKQLILKNPTNTGRADKLLALFPNAKFIHIHRNPYDVFVSTRNLYRKVMPLCNVQKIDWDYIDTMILDFYSQLMQRYFENERLFTNKNFIEITYKELETHPTQTLKRIYQKLALGDFKTVQSNVEVYLETIKDYKKNSFQLSDKDIKMVNDKCAFVFEKLGYKMHQFSKEKVKPLSSIA